MKFIIACLFLVTLANCANINRHSAPGHSVFHYGGRPNHRLRIYRPFVHHPVPHRRPTPHRSTIRDAHVRHRRSLDPVHNVGVGIHDSGMAMSHKAMSGYGSSSSSSSSSQSHHSSSSMSSSSESMKGAMSSTGSEIVAGSHRLTGHQIDNGGLVDYAIGKHILRSPIDMYRGYPGITAHRDSDYWGSQDSTSSMGAKGSSALLGGTSSKISSSKSTSSESSKGTKIKSSSNFGVGQQNINADMFGATHTQGLNLGGWGLGGIHGGGFSGQQDTAIHQEGLNAQTGFLTGSSNTEIEQTESNKQSASETHDESHDTHLIGGSQYEAEGQTASHANQHAREGEYVAVNDHGVGHAVGTRHGVAEGHGVVGEHGIVKGQVIEGHGIDGGHGAVYGRNKEYDGSSDSLSSIHAHGTSAINAGHSTGTSSKKSTSSESSKGTKIKTGTTFGAGASNLHSQNMMGAQTSDVVYGGHGGIGGVGVSAGHSTAVAGHDLSADSAYIQGSSNTEIEQTESNKHSESETNESSQSSGVVGVNQFEMEGQTAEHQQQHGHEDVYAFER